MLQLWHYRVTWSSLPPHTHTHTHTRTHTHTHTHTCLLSTNRQFFLHRKFLETTLTSGDSDTSWMWGPTRTINWYTTSCPLSNAHGVVISGSGFRWRGPCVVVWVLPDVSKERNAWISRDNWTKKNQSWHQTFRMNVMPEFQGSTGPRKISLDIRRFERT
jgi:hypothetical protein